MSIGTRNSYSADVNDGFFEIQYRADGIFLIVNPPVGKGKRVETGSVLEKLNRKRIKGFNREMVQIAVDRSDRSPVRIADYQDEVRVDASASVTVTPDRMKAFIMITPPDGGQMITSDQMLELLSSQGVIDGINKSAIDALARYPVYNQNICVAEGIPPVNGQNGKVQFHFDISREHKPTILEDGSVDFRELNLIVSAVKGQVLCSLVPPVPGIRGTTVTGGEVPALEGKPGVLPRGRNVEISEDGQNLIAAIDGQVSYQDGKVNVFSSYEVRADVDNSTGNIYFVGNVSIRGSVLSGFTVEAGGNVEVWGVVEGAVIKAGGDIILRRGMLGHGKGLLVSSGSIIAKYIEHSTVVANNEIKAEAIMHSHIKCGNKLELSGKKGLLVGGNCKVGKEIAAKVIGSHMATVTELEVGVDPTLRERLKSLKDEVTKLEEDIRKADQAVVLLKKLEMAGALSPEKQELMAKGIRTKLFFTNKVSDLKEEMIQIEAQLQQDSYGKIRAFNCIYPGVRVTIGTCMMFVKETLQYCTLYRDGADVRVGAIDR